MEQKKNLVQTVRENVDTYSNIFVFSVENMRNNKLKDVRLEWKHSRFFFGKNNVMAKALGREPADEYRENLNLVSSHLRGQRGLLFTNKTEEEVCKWAESYGEPDFARSGSEATETVILDAGPLPKFSHAMEPQLRKLGLPVTLKKGVVTLMHDHKVCQDGDILTPEQAQILKLFGTMLAVFSIKILVHWNNSGKFHEIASEENASNGSNDDSDNEDLDEDD